MISGASAGSAGAGAMARLKTLLEMIRWEHTIFALPFALVGALLAADGIPPWRILFWIVVAMIGGRSSAMCFNRLVDQEFDALNPRTASRALPAGLLSRSSAWIFTFVSAGLLVLSAAQLNRTALLLSPLALVMIWGYSLTKRFTRFCHLVLGLAISAAPAGAWIAVRGRLDMPALLLSGAVLCWVAGFDIIYALQDETFDRETGLHSLPASLGTAGSLLASRLLHLVAVQLLIGAGAVLQRGVFYWVGIAAVAGLLLWEQSLVRPGDLSRVNAAFFTANGFISLGFLAAVVMDLLL